MEQLVSKKKYTCELWIKLFRYVIEFKFQYVNSTHYKKYPL